MLNLGKRTSPFYFLFLLKNHLLIPLPHLQTLDPLFFDPAPPPPPLPPRSSPAMSLQKTKSVYFSTVSFRSRYSSPSIFLQGYVEELVEQNFTNYVDTVNREPILFGDYRNALSEDPRLYEDIVDYEAAKAVFDEVCNVLFPCLCRFN